MIPYSTQSISEDDIDAVISTLRSGLITQGPKIQAFEECVRSYCGAMHAIALSSGTAALHLACIALDLKPGDLVWTSPITFVASANCARYCGADVDFVDINVATGNLCIDRLEEKLKKAAADNKLPRILIPVHYAGNPCDMEAISKLTREYGIRIIEDASHALGARHNETPVGSGRYSDITVFSFHPVKMITTGEGGMAVCNDKALASRIHSLRTHGITKDNELFSDTSHGGWYYEQQMLGFNYRITDLQAALGISQMSRLDEFVRTRQSIAERYQSLLTGSPLSYLDTTDKASPSWHLFPIQVDSRKAVYDSLRDSGIGVQIHYIPVHTQPYYKNLGFQKGDFPNAELFYSREISLPIFHTLTSEQQDEVIAALQRALS